jgi:RHS repeat-associated protein
MTTKMRWFGRTCWSSHTGRRVTSEIGTGVDQTLMRSYHGWWTRFNEPDPWEGSYDLTDPQSFNRYTYVQNDPVNFVDPTGMLTVGPVNGGQLGVVTVKADAGPDWTAFWELWMFGMQMGQRLLPPLIDGLELSPDGGGGGSGIGGQDVGDLADLSSNIWIIGTGDSELERHKSEVLKRLEYMARNQSCNDAFRRAGLPTPFELITNGRIALAARPLLTNPANNSLLGISEDVRAKANKSNAPAQTIRPQFTSTGKAIIVLGMASLAS